MQRLAEQGRLLVAGDAGDRHAAEPERRRRPRRRPRSTSGPPAASRAGRRRASSSSSSHSPRVDVEEHRARGVGRVGDVQPAAGQLPDQPGVDGAEGELAGLGLRARAGDVVEDPGDLGAGEVGVEHAGRSVADQRLRGRRRGARRRTAAVRRSCQTMALQIGSPVCAVPDDGRLALVGDADGGDVGRLQLRPGRAPRRRRRSARPRSPPGRARPSRAWGRSAELLLARRPDDAVVVEHDGAGAGGALVEGEDVGHVYLRPPRDRGRGGIVSKCPSLGSWKLGVGSWNSA